MTKKTYLLIGIIAVIIIVLIGIYISSQKTTSEADENSLDANSIVVPENLENVVPTPSEIPTLPAETPVENVVPTPDTIPAPPIENVVPAPETNNVE